MYFVKALPALGFCDPDSWQMGWENASRRAGFQLWAVGLGRASAAAVLRKLLF